MTSISNKTEEKQKRRGSVLIYESLRDDILWLKIAPGSAIDEVALATRFEVSRTPIREALLLLQGEWLVQFLPNRTSIVAPLSLNNSGKYFDSHLMLGRMAARAAALSGHAHKDHLMAHVSRFRMAIEADQHRDALRAHIALARDLTKLTENIFLERYFGHSLDSGIRVKIVYYFPNASRDELNVACDLLETLIAAVASGDAEASDATMRALIVHEVEIILRALQPAYGDTMEISNLEGVE